MSEKKPIREEMKMAQVINETNTGLATSINRENALSRPSYQAHQILHIGFTVAPIIAGLDKWRACARTP